MGRDCYRPSLLWAEMSRNRLGVPVLTFPILSQFQQPTHFKFKPKYLSRQQRQFAEKTTAETNSDNSNIPLIVKKLLFHTILFFIT